jgi:hypothetical protein
MEALHLTSSFRWGHITNAIITPTTNARVSHFFKFSTFVLQSQNRNDFVNISLLLRIYKVIRVT